VPVLESREQFLPKEAATYLVRASWSPGLLEKAAMLVKASCGKSPAPAASGLQEVAGRFAPKVTPATVAPRIFSKSTAPS
jgi:hypothetical protein